MMRSAKRPPRSLWEPKFFLRHRTKARSSRSAWLFVGSTSSLSTKVPQGELVFEDVGAGAANAAHVEAPPWARSPPTTGRRGGHEGAESSARDGAVADAVPFVDHQLRPEEQIFAELARRARPLGEA
jgi:hypothetical protein